MPDAQIINGFDTHPDPSILIDFVLNIQNDTS